MDSFEIDRIHPATERQVKTLRSELLSTRIYKGKKVALPVESVVSLINRIEVSEAQLKRYRKITMGYKP